MNQQQPPQPQLQGQAQNQNTKKSSFQITSVTIDSSVSNDGGDDSADELDSHTGDSSDVGTDTSRHPSESRGAVGAGVDDNFTRNDVFFNSAPLSSMGSAPVIPTSSQFGLAIVSSTGTGEVVTSGSTLPVVSSTNSPPSSEVATTETQAISSSVPSTTDKHEAERDHVHNRFKVVKIVSTEPTKKGRWTCMDYLDHTTTTSTTTATNAPSKDPSTQLHSQQIPQQLPIPHGSPPHQPHTVIQSQGEVLHQPGLQPQVPQAPMTSSPPQQPLPVLTGASSHPNEPHQASHLQAHSMQQHNVQVMPPTELPPHPVDSTVNMNGLNNGNSYLQMNHNIGMNSHNTEMHHVQNAGSMNINHSMVSSTNIPNVAVYQNAPHQQQQQQYYTGGAVVQGNMGPSQGYSSQPQVVGNQPAPQHQQTFSHQQQQLPNHEVVQQHSSSNPPLIGQNVQNQVHQSVPGQSLPHGSVMQMTSNVMPNNGSQQQQPHTSLGHSLPQQGKVPAFLPQTSQQGQVQQQGSTQFSQQQQPAQQIMPHQVNIQPQSSQAQCSNQSQQQAPTQQLMPQQMNMQQQQQQPQQQAYQQPQQSQQNSNMMMSGIPNIHQQHHMQMTSSQVPIQMQVAQGQSAGQGQGQAIYNQQPQMHQVQMTGQQMPISNQQQMLSQQPQQIMQPQSQYSNQPNMVNQQGNQQQGQLIMMNAQQIQGQAPQQQNIMPPQQMVPSQVMQNSQMNTIVQQPQMVNQSTLQGQVQHMSMHDQPYELQSMQAQNSYQGQQSQPQNTMGNIQQQGVMHQQQQQQQQQYQQTQPAVVQQTMMTNQMNQLPSGQHVQSQIQQNQPVSQHSQVPMSQPQQQQQQPMSLNQDQPMQMYQNQNQQPIQTPSASIGSMSNTVSNVQNLVAAPPSNSQMGGQFVSSTNMPQVNSGVEIPNQPTMSSIDHQQHMQVSNSSDGHSSSQPVLQTQSQPILQHQPSLTLNTSSQPSLPSSHSSGTPVGDGATIHSMPASIGKVDDCKSDSNDDGDSASGTNTVAIDNKIEQAMDLVKSHLMFAVREEVEVLKEKISELMERITQLEHENTILRAGASQETLALLIASKPPANSNCTNANS